MGTYFMNAYDDSIIKFSIIIPVYNVEKFLRECLNSIASQTLKNFEVICIDDGSTYNSSRILQEYQLDAWVFRDELEYWCEQGYDYLGAPWFEEKTPTAKMRLKAGNGGLSLRNTQVCLNAIKHGAYHAFTQCLNKNKSKNVLFNILNFPVAVISYLLNKLCSKPMHKYKNGEDYIWVYETKLKTIPPEIAYKFYFEAQPSRLYEMNNRQLPFGCHAFEKIEYDFWKEFINVREVLSGQ